jgi:SNF2 family DNA or RNA helicase
LDEAQTIKNAETQTARAVCELNARFRLTITGTPIENHLNELWSQFRFLMPDLLGEQASFQAEVQASSADSRFLQRIRRRIKPFILRRKKEEVAKDLPEKIEQVVWIEMTPEQRSFYDQFLANAKRSLDGKGRMEVLESILRLRQICCHSLLVADEVSESAKLEALLEDLDTIREEGKKALIYSQFTAMLSLIGKALKAKEWNYAYLDGSTTNRAEVVDSFQNDPEISLFLISLKAGGIGLNLTSADYVLLFDPWWNDAAENQAVNRAHRIGRIDTVIAKRYIIAESIEEKMMTLKAHKRGLIAGILDHDDFSAGSTLTDEDLRYLLS